MVPKPVLVILCKKLATPPLEGHRGHFVTLEFKAKHCSSLQHMDGNLVHDILIKGKSMS